jgi:hypothetical protein
MLAMLFLLAVDPTSQGSTPPPPAQKPAIKMECRNITEPGSRIPERVCKSPDEWAQLAKETQDDLNSARTRRGAGAINPE